MEETMTHHDPHHDPHHVEEIGTHHTYVAHGGGGGYGAIAWMVAMVLFVALAIVVIIGFFVWAA
jgi:hypothetical protein